MSADRGLAPHIPPATEYWLVDRHGCHVHFRPLIHTDRAAVEHLFPQQSAQTRFFRFNTPHTELNQSQLASLFDLDYHARFAWGVEVTCDSLSQPAAIGRYVGYPDGRRADVALTVSDSWQHRGIGGHLLDLLIITAHQHGFASFETIVRADNHPMLHLLQRRGATLSAPSHGEIDVILDLDRAVQRLIAHPLNAAHGDPFDHCGNPTTTCGSPHQPPDNGASWPVEACTCRRP